MSANHWQGKNPPKDYTDDDYIYMGKQALAGRRVNQAIANGKMKRASKCMVCGKKCKTQAHHWNGYDNWFDVWFVCPRCNGNLPHNRVIDLFDAKRIIIGRYFKQPMHYFNWLSRQDVACSVCGIEDKADNLIIIDDSYDDKYYLCELCHAVFETEKT